MSAGPRVGIVIPTGNPERFPAERCIRHVRETTADLDVDLRVVVSSGADFRLSRSINQGLREAAEDGADAFVLLNDDAFMDPDWLHELLRVAEAHPQAGVVGTVLRYENGGLQHAGGQLPLEPLEYLAVATRHRAPFWALRNIAKHRFQRHTYMFSHYASVSPRHRLDFLTGASCLITRACYEKVGGYDEDYLFGSEDVDYSLRALDAGFELALATRARGIHLDRTTGAALKDKAEASTRTFLEKWATERIHALTHRDGRKGIYA